MTSVSNRRRAESAPTQTRGCEAMTRGTQASCSNIQAGTSRHRPMSPPRLHRNAVILPRAVTSWTWMERPLQGCHGYSSVRSVVLWAFRRRVVDPLEDALQVPLGRLHLAALIHPREEDAD